MDGESDWSSILGNFLPKTQARRTVDAEPQGQARAGKNPWRQAPMGRESTHLSKRAGVLRGREGCAGAREWARESTHLSKRAWCAERERGLCWGLGGLGCWGMGGPSDTHCSSCSSRSPYCSRKYSARSSSSMMPRLMAVVS